MRFNFADLLNFSVQKLFGDKTMRFIPLFSGSSGNCSVIQTEKATLLVDAGLTGKAVCGAGFRRKEGIGGKTQNKALPQ